MNGPMAALAILAGLTMPLAAYAGPVSENAARAEQLQLSGDPVAADAALRNAYAQLWATGPLFARRAVLVAKPASGFGLYEPRSNNVFSDGEPIRLYVEPAGYGFAESDGGFNVSFQVDAEIRANNGTTIWGRQDIHRFGASGAMRPFEFFQTLTFDLAGLPGGDYTIAITLKDQVTGKQALIETPIEIQ